MSTIILPNFPGMDVAYQRKPLYTTNVQNSPSGREVAISYESYPRYEWTLKFNVLRNYLTVAEAQQLEAIFHLLKGRGDYFLFDDPEYGTVSNVQIGTGNGTTATYRACRLISEPNSGLSTLEPINDCYNVVVKVAGVTKTAGTHYTISSAGIITFTAGNIPTAGQAVTLSCNFRYRCRMLKDELQMARSHFQLWNTQFHFRSIKV